MTQSPHKLCKDCKHCLKPVVGFSKCGRAPFQDLETGDPDFVFCNIERQNLTGCCGPGARFFEANDQAHL